MIKHTLKRKPMSDAKVAQLAAQKEGKIQSALKRGLSATSTKKGSGRVHVSGWNKLDKAARAFDTNSIEGVPNVSSEQTA